MKISKFINNLEDTTLHTSAFAEAADDRYSSMSTRTFEQRMKVGQNRQVIRSYRDSLVGRGNVQRPKRFVSSRPEVQSSPVAERPALDAPKASGFREPPTRGFDPFS